jgi:hypothetical protein
MKKITIHVPIPKPRDPNFRDMLNVKNQAFVDRKKKKNREICREKVVDES